VLVAVEALRPRLGYDVRRWATVFPVAVSVWAIVCAAMIPSLVRVGRGDHPPLERRRMAEIAPATESGQR